jgi:hypothetical protein
MTGIHFKKQAAWIVALLIAVVHSLTAQTGAGTIQGSVKDPSGAVIVSARVKLVHITTSELRETETNGVGFYTFPQAQLGKYQLTVMAPGMITWQGNLEVIVGQTAEVNVSLKVGASATEISVAGDVTPLVTDSSPTVSQVLERSRIEQLPLNGRSLTGLMGAVTPGAEGTRINGMWDAAFELMQDGAVLRNLDTGSVAQRPPGLDTVEEFRVETSVSSARYDRPATSIVSTRSGTNVIHGSMFETARNSAIGVARRRQS